MKPEPLITAIEAIKTSQPEVGTLLMTPQGKRFEQNDAVRLAQYSFITLVCCRYEGVDERVRSFVDEEVSIGDYILTGGELASLVMCDAIARNVDGVLGNADSLTVESFETPLLEAPSFSKPKEYEEIEVPKEYLKGNHSKISALKFALSECKTKFFRPEQLLKHQTKEII